MPHAGSTETPGTQGSAAGHRPEATLLVERTSIVKLMGGQQ